MGVLRVDKEDVAMEVVLMEGVVCCWRSLVEFVLIDGVLMESV